MYHPAACSCRGPQTASDFESGQSSEDYAAKLIEEVWQRSDECKKAEAVDLTQTTPAVITDAGSLSAAAARFQEVGTGSAGEGPGGGHEMDPKPECDCDPPQECTIAVDENVSVVCSALVVVYSVREA